MTLEEKRDAAVQSLIGLLKNNPFTMEYKVVKKPKGIKIIFEVTREEMDALMQMLREKRND